MKSRQYDKKRLIPVSDLNVEMSYSKFDTARPFLVITRSHDVMAKIWVASAKSVALWTFSDSKSWVHSNPYPVGLIAAARPDSSLC